MYHYIINSIAVSIASADQLEKDLGKYGLCQIQWNIIYNTQADIREITSNHNLLCGSQGIALGLFPLQNLPQSAQNNSE